MIDIVPDRRARADDPLRHALAARILTMPDQPLPRTLVPEPSVLAGKVLFVPTSGITLEQCGAARRLADADGLDLVLVDRTTTGSFAFTLGISFYRGRLWRYGCTMWRPADAAPACFVPHDRDDPACYCVRNAMLFAGEGRPWANREDCERGFHAAQSGLKRLIEGR